MDVGKRRRSERKLDACAVAFYPVERGLLEYNIDAFRARSTCPLRVFLLAPSPLSSRSRREGHARAGGGPIPDAEEGKCTGNERHLLSSLF